MFTAGFSEEVIREEADEVTLRAHEEGVRRTFIDTTNSGDDRYGPRWSMRIGMPSAGPFTRESRDKSGKRCTTTLKNCTRQ